MRFATGVLAIAAVQLSGCGSSNSSQAEADQHATAVPQPSIPVPAVPQMDPCAMKLASATSGAGKLIFPSIDKRLEWGASEGRVQSVANSIASKTSRDDSGLTAYANGYDDWIQFEFSSGVLSGVHERHNNKSRQAPFVDGFLSKLKISLGDKAATSTDGDGACNAVWQTGKNSTKAVWRDSEWFVDVYYTPSNGKPTRSSEEESAIWEFYTPLEDRLGKEAALSATAKHFKISRDDVFQVIVRGLEQGRPLPEITPLPLPQSSKGPAPEAAGREALPKEDRRSYDALKAKGYSDTDARQAAAAIRRLCEAGKGADCQ